MKSRRKTPAQRRSDRLSQSLEACRAAWQESDDRRRRETAALHQEVTQLKDQLETAGAELKTARDSRMEEWKARTTALSKLATLEGMHKSLVEDFQSPLYQAFGLDPSTPYVKAARAISARMMDTVERKLFDKQGECLNAMLEAMRFVFGRKA